MTSCLWAPFISSYLTACSPWVCNCDHAWSEHKQVEVQKQLLPAAASLLEAVADLNRWDLLKRGQEDNGGKQ